MTKNETNNCISIRIWWLLATLKKSRNYSHTTISWGENGSDGTINAEVSIFSKDKFLRLMYQQVDHYSREKKSFNYQIPLVTTPCNFGGFRFWFQCSLISTNGYCGRRVGVLYKSGDYFGCRHCHSLTYRSQNKNWRNGFNILMRSYDCSDEIESLEKNVKRITYKGKLTKKQQRIEALYIKAGVSRTGAFIREIERKYGKNTL